MRNSIGGSGMKLASQSVLRNQDTRCLADVFAYDVQEVRKEALLKDFILMQAGSGTKAVAA